jgi:hypothetical protein
MACQKLPCVPAARDAAGGQIIDEAGNVRLLSLHDAVTCFGVSSL